MLSRDELFKWFGSTPVELSPLQVTLRGGSRDHFEEANGRFKKLVQNENVIKAYKERQAYEKPSEKKRRKKRQAYERKLATEARQRQMANGEWDKRQKKKQEKKAEREKQRRKDDSDLIY